jgi:hypothetical protein
LIAEASCAWWVCWPPRECAARGEHVQRRLAPLGLWREGAWRLGDTPRPRWPASGLKTSKVIGNKHPDVQALLDEPALLSAVDALLGGRAFDRTAFRRPQILFTLPNSDTWMVPTDWHVDSPRLASGRAPGAPGDAYFTDLRVLHSGAPNAADRPRIMATHRFVRTDVMQELTETHG